MSLDGVIYFPNQDLQFSGGTVADPISTMMIARTVDFTGNANVGDFNGSALNASPLLVRVTLVE